jgi:hypothetical protein
LTTPANVLAGVMARPGGVAPLRLLDVLDIQGNSYHWASQPIASAAALGIVPVFTGTTPYWNNHLRVANWDDTYLNWLVSDGPWHLSRSTQANTGNVVIQNMSGNSLQRSMNQLIIRTAFEGALFAFREWNKEAGRLEFGMRGHLSIVDVSEASAEFLAESLFNGSDYQALDIVSETCRWRYGSTACGDTSDNPCKNTFTTCRLVNKERFSAFINNYVDLQTFSPTTASMRDVNRARKV